MAGLFIKELIARGDLQRCLVLIRENDHRRGRPSRFIRGSAHELVTLRKSARRKAAIRRPTTQVAGWP
jgi:hypothetical protein